MTPVSTSRLAEPARFGEIITNDVRVAQAARELEQQHADAGKRRGVRRVASLKGMSNDHEDEERLMEHIEKQKEMERDVMQTPPK